MPGAVLYYVNFPAWNPYCGEFVLIMIRDIVESFVMAEYSPMM